MEASSNNELICMLKEMANNEDFESQKMLAHIYYEGEGVKVDLDLSFYWSKEAVSHKECNQEEYIVINRRIAHIYRKQKKYDDALKIYNHLFELPHLDQDKKDHIHMIIADINFCLKNYTIGEEIFLYFINRKLPKVDKNILEHSYQNLSVIYLERKDFQNALDMTNHLSEDDDIFINGKGFIHELMGDYQQAHRCYLLSANKNNKFAQLNLAYLYDNGLGVDKDHEKAFIYYEKAQDAIEEWSISREKHSK